MNEIFVGLREDFDDDVRKGVTVNGREVFVFRRNNRFYAFENRCPHSGGPVGEGTIIGRVRAVLDDEKRFVREEFADSELQIVCPWHGWEYSIETGACAGDARISLRRYQVIERAGSVFVSD